ncbi:glycosyl hydrolase family 17 protein [uncultured Tenacibaculum sp.]|uniref:glycosyl hydrolase family 17 protein n=1 Tax=uncultured Tenacibaculum sp. TaxID=174713 RepID=UPI002631050E|nr:glycosyl hydrolase family 17 protein [uncultured Tenacibaculum sp.]
MKSRSHIILLIVLLISCGKEKTNTKPLKKPYKEVKAKDILGNSNYLAISYGGYRKNTREIQPTIDELKEDMKILHAMGVKLLRTYNVHLPHASNLLQAISELKKEEASFEMYVMLGAWIDCKNAWTGLPVDHTQESEQNKKEIDEAVRLANQYPDIVKIIAVGNEAMVKWATSYYVQPWVILKWVNHLQNLKKEEKLDKDLWITSSDNFASWGGGSNEYHVEDLNKLIAAVDFISMHTYPMHDTHYNPRFWGVSQKEDTLSSLEKIKAAMLRARRYAESQYHGVERYMKSIGVDKPIHIGETGWASYSNEFYGNKGSKATDQYKEALFYEHMRDWTAKEGMSCFYFEAFDETWKDAQNPEGSENHFGLFTVDGKAKYALWDLVDKGVFKGLKRGGNTIVKTYNGSKENLLVDVLMPPLRKELVITP